MVNPSPKQLEHSKERCFVAINVKMFSLNPQNIKLHNTTYLVKIHFDPIMNQSYMWSYT